MKRYMKRSFLGLNDTTGMMFAVGKAAYFNHPDSTPLGDPLDVLYTPFVARVAKRPGFYLEVEINRNARVFLAMTTSRMQHEKIGVPKRISGLKENWRNLRGITTKDEKPIWIGSRSRGTSYELPPMAYVVESYYSRNAKIILPSPRNVRVDGEEVTQYFLFFAKSSAISRPAIAFDYPETPKNVWDPEKWKKLPSPAPVTPNEDCPGWLHDLYKTSSRDLNVANKEKEIRYWRTWHPMIDPIYWCYFDHEHGSYPGKYEPRFDYTAWKTPDNSTRHGRQNESDQGFKVFSIPLHDQKRYVIVTIHMQCSYSRRFHARHHTVIFAVLDQNWRLQMELQMKVDFGFGAVALNDFSHVPINKKQRMIRDMLGNPVKRFRRFNVLNLENYPRKINRRYRMRTGAQPTMKNKKLIEAGVYEKWVAPLNTCQTCKRGSHDSFVFDVRNVATGKKSEQDPDSAPMTRLTGDSIDRKIDFLFSDAMIGPQFCHFKGTKSTRGVFYTDPYFETTFATSGKNRVRQFIKQGTREVVFKRGQYTAVDPWAGYFELSHGHEISRRSHTNVEYAVKANVN